MVHRFQIKIRFFRTGKNEEVYREYEIVTAAGAWPAISFRDIARTRQGDRGR